MSLKDLHAMTNSAELFEHPKVSIVVPTMRFGGLDVLFGGLKNQTVKDYELLLIDELYDVRKREVAEYAEELGIPLRHMKPKKREGYVSLGPGGICNAQNTGLIYAEGDYVMFGADYVWFSPDCLERHLKLQKESGRVTVGPTHFCASAPTRNMRGKITVFDRLYEEKPEKVVVKEFRFPIRQDEDVYPLKYFYAVSHFNLCPNAVFPLKECVLLNGFDERFDQGHGMGDNNLVFRLYNFGVEFLLDKRNEAFHVAHPWSTLPSTGVEHELFLKIATNILRQVESLKAPNPVDIIQERVRVRWEEWKKEGHLEWPVRMTTYEEPGQIQRVNWLIDRCKGTSSILEVGCSGGYVLRKVGGEAGIDINPETIEENRKRYPDIRWVVGDATVGLPFEDEEYEIVLLSEILEHIPWENVWALLGEAWRVCSKKLLITIPNACVPNYNRRNVECMKHRWACTMDKLWWITCAFVPRHTRTLLFPDVQQLGSPLRMKDAVRMSVQQDNDFIYIEIIKGE